MTHPADAAPPPARGPVRVLANGIGWLGLTCLALVTLASPGATRMYAWPWSLAYAGALLAPALMLALRAFDPRQPLALPATKWCIAVIATVVAVLASALASPHRGPSLQWSAPLLAGLAAFFVVFDAIQTSPTRAARFAGVFFTAIAMTSLVLWASQLPGRAWTEIADARNPYPLGHSNYTAGLALLALPWLVSLGWRAHGALRLVWGTGAALALAMLFTSGSRGGLLGLGALTLAALAFAPIAPRKKIRLALACAVTGLGLALAHPRTRAMFTRPNPTAAPNLSNVQRTAMLTAAWHMGRDRPLLGWGPGTTPLVYPRYRARLDGGAENVLQLHSLPAQLWAELGLAGLLGALALLALTLPPVCQLLDDKPSRTANDPRPVVCHLIVDKWARPAGVALVGYAVFSLTDWQLDVPVFALAVAFCTAWLAAPAATPSPAMRRTLGAIALGAVGLVGLLGRADPTPELNLRALALARDPTHADEAIALLRQSLALNPDQEIAHFNLGWLLLTRDPAAAEKHFLAAAHLVPDKGGVYFGVGLARLNQGHAATAARAFALECLDDPAFFSSPWWREPAIGALREAAVHEFTRLVVTAQSRLPADTWAAAQLTHLSALASRLGLAPAGGEKNYRRERTGYPVLMRNLDLATPVDLFDVREAAAPADAALPAKGWLPSPLLLDLLDASAPATTIPKS